MDDDEGLLLLMMAALRAEDYAVTGFSSGKQLIASLEQAKPDLLLLDLKLKDIEGPTLLEQLAQRGMNVPFVVVTGQGDEKVAVEMMRRGAVDYVRKDTGLLDLLPGVVGRALTTIARDRALVEAEIARQRLEAEVLEISENEQRRIGQDLHDGLGQQLTAIELMCQSVVSDLEAAHSGLVPQVSRIGGFLRDAITQTRMLAHSLAPYRLDANGLEAALQELVAQSALTGKIKCRLVCPAPVALKDDAALHLYRIAQEAVNNAVKHSRAERLTVSLAQRENFLELEVADNGRGLPVDRLAGIGLQVMRHRASVIGADLAMESEPGKGTVIRCRLPLSP